ncbi:MAG: ferrous iron transport protein B [Schleiferiaceae bacterium]|nr:ferrous iron transport protein B [Schleiferiaceae bacterium]
MANKDALHIALVGNPNTGKTSLFNQLTGLNQKVGNYPGITVERKEGQFKLPNGKAAVITDLPGTYSINPSSADENIVIDTLLERNQEKQPDVVLVVADVINLKRNLFLLSQVMDLGYRTVLAINMADQMEKRGVQIDTQAIEKAFGCSTVLVSMKKKSGIQEVKELLQDSPIHEMPFIFDLEKQAGDVYKELNAIVPEATSYQGWLCLSQFDSIRVLTPEEEGKLNAFRASQKERVKKIQHKETIRRYQFINDVLKQAYEINPAKGTGLRERIDKVIKHRFWGYVVFLSILLLIFQSVFSWASYPMDLIDEWFAQLASFVSKSLPAGPLTDLLADGVIAGLGGIVIFIPQIAILFFFIALLEESGYMSRVVFLMDKIMRKFGLSGKSVVPLISGTACAIPAVMAARNIENWKERLITILVTPFTTCSARLPVYTIIISLVVPETRVWGVFNLQGLTLLALYILGFLTALLASYILNLVLKFKTKSYFVIEMPDLKRPMFRNVWQTVYQKTQAFVFEAGKIILAISIILWVLSSYGPGEKFNSAESIVKSEQPELSLEEYENAVAAFKLENSYIGIAGKFIEPTIKPLGYDWKIGIALISSFAAREVFVGTLSTIYSVGSNDEDVDTIRGRLASEINPDTGLKRYDLPLGLSLLVFYAFAMQCMSTLAVVKRETNSWKWPMLQLVFMTGLAYVSSLAVFNMFS